MHEYFVYILHCRDGSYYTGVTSDLQLRLFQHAEGVEKSSYTFKRRPLKLVYTAEFENIYEAIAWEKTIKRWSRKKKEALIQHDQEALEKGARSQYRVRIDQIRSEIHKSVMVSSTNHD